MKKIICIILFLSCLVNSYATNPVAIDKIKSISCNYDNKWTPEIDLDGFIISYKDKIVIRAEGREGIFKIVGKVEQIKNLQGSESLTFECVNEKSEACILEFTFNRKLGSPCMYLRLQTRSFRYILANADEYY